MQYRVRTIALSRLQPNVMLRVYPCVHARVCMHTYLYVLQARVQTFALGGNQLLALNLVHTATILLSSRMRRIRRRLCCCALSNLSRRRRGLRGAEQESCLRLLCDFALGRQSRGLRHAARRRRRAAEDRTARRRLPPGRRGARGRVRQRTRAGLVRWIARTSRGRGRRIGSRCVAKVRMRCGRGE